MRYEDELFALAGEIFQEAAIESLGELLRRGIPSEAATGIIVISMATVMVSLAHKYHTDTGNTAASKEEIHKRIDQMWETLNGPQKKEKRH